MKSTRLLLPAILSMTLLLGCKNSTGPANEKDNGAAKTSSASTKGLPFLTANDLNILTSQVDRSDIIFYKLPVSVSQDDPPSAKSTVAYIAPVAPTMVKNCTPTGRLSWISNGKIIREADFFLGDGCNYFTFLENNKPVYRNALHPEAIKFFNTIVEQVKQQANQ